MAAAEGPPGLGAAGRRDLLSRRLVAAALGALETATVYLGDRLGLYRALAGLGPATPAELAGRTHTQERYVREWLEQQAVAGILDVEDGAAAPRDRRYSVPLGHAEVLLDSDSLSYLAPLARQVIGTLHPLRALRNAFRAGGGIPYGDYGPDLREGIAEGNRAMFLALLGTTWLPALPDLHARLAAASGSRVLDVGCGSGWSSIALARAYPHARVDGVDLDGESVALARDNVAAAGLSARVSIHLGEAAAVGPEPLYDLAMAFECIHDMAQPVPTLAAMRRAVRPGGAVLIVDERAAESFAAPGDELERLLYGFSVLHCLPAGLADAPSVGTGTVMRPQTLRGYAEEAGFSRLEVLPIDHHLWRFYRLRE